MRKQWFLLLAAIFLGVNAKSQSCAEIASNPLCAQTDEHVEQNLSAGSFEYGCFEAKTSFSYLVNIHTLTNLGDLFYNCYGL
jgi:hypothetical protein